MTDNSKIEWTQATWNPVTGCTKVSPGCDHCYAETFAERWRGTPGHHFENGFDLTLRPERVGQPLRWTRPRRIFVNSMSDLFHADVPDEFIAEVFAVMAAAHWHTFQLLTKRHGRMRSLLGDPAFRELVQGESAELAKEGVDVRTNNPWETWPLPNLWLGVSVEDQKRADLRVPALLATPAAVRWISAEPLLGPVDLRQVWNYCPEHDRPAQSDGWGFCVNCQHMRGLDWVVVGGESGPGARPMNPEWVRDLRDQCTAVGVAYFFKQWGAWTPTGKVGLGGTLPGEIRIGAPVDEHGFRVEMRRTSKKAAGRELDGRTWDEYPEVAAR
jgi:protein gp37